MAQINPRDEKGNARCPGCEEGAQALLYRPVAAEGNYAWEIWWCMDCKTRWVVWTDERRDRVGAQHWVNEGLFSGHPWPFGPEPESGPNSDVGPNQEV